MVIIEIESSAANLIVFAFRPMKLLVFSSLIVALWAWSTPDASNVSSRRNFVTQSLAMAAAVVSSLPLVAQAASSSPIMQWGNEKEIMSPKAHGTSNVPVQENLNFGVDRTLADRICNFNRHYAERAGYFTTTSWQDQVLTAKEPLTFYDSNTGKPLFRAPIGRSAEDLVAESKVHGWPSFRDDEVVWQNVRVLRNSGETVSVDGTHLGHNLPDRLGNRYCINVVSIAGKPTPSVV